MRNFFRKGNLIALRELALRRTADRIDDEMLQYRRTMSAAPVWQTRESLLLCIGSDERSEKLVRGTARMAAQLEVPWHCIHVESPQLRQLSDAVRQRVLKVLKLAHDAGATTGTPVGNTLATVIVKYAHDHNLSRASGGDGWRPRSGPAERARRNHLPEVRARPQGERDAGCGPVLGDLPRDRGGARRSGQHVMSDATPKVLVVDDEAEIRRFVRMSLEHRHGGSRRST